jgi:uncharacterized protein (TIGR00369 family)
MDDLSNQLTVHEQVFAIMRELTVKMQEQNVQLQLPHASLATMGTRFTDLLPGKMLAAEIPFHNEFRNPTGVMQGGFLCAAFDEVFGPLSYMAARGPAVTIEMNTSFIRPFQAKHQRLTIRAEVLTKSRSLILLEAKAVEPNGKLIAVAKVSCLCLTNAQSSRTVEP